jgi:hypothetical protein
MMDPTPKRGDTFIIYIAALRKSYPFNLDGLIPARTGRLNRNAHVLSNRRHPPHFPCGEGPLDDGRLEAHGWTAATRCRFARLDGWTPCQILIRKSQLVRKPKNIEKKRSSQPRYRYVIIRLRSHRHNDRRQRHQALYGYFRSSAGWTPRKRFGGKDH